MKPETKALKQLLADLGISRGENTVNTGPNLGPVAILTTDQARRTSVERAGEITAAGYAVLLHVYRCGCPASVWLCQSSSPELKRTVRDWTHECPKGVTELEPVTPIGWLEDAKREVEAYRTQSKGD